MAVVQGKPIDSLPLKTLKDPIPSSLGQKIKAIWESIKGAFISLIRYITPNCVWRWVSEKLSPKPAIELQPLDPTKNSPSNLIEASTPVPSHTLTPVMLPEPELSGSAAVDQSAAHLDLRKTSDVPASQAIPWQKVAKYAVGIGVAGIALWYCSPAISNGLYSAYSAVSSTISSWMPAFSGSSASSTAASATSGALAAAPTLATAAATNATDAALATAAATNATDAALATAFVASSTTGIIDAGLVGVIGAATGLAICYNSRRPRSQSGLNAASANDAQPVAAVPPPEQRGNPDEQPTHDAGALVNVPPVVRQSPLASRALVKSQRGVVTPSLTQKIMGDHVKRTFFGSAQCPAVTVRLLRPVQANVPPVEQRSSLASRALVKPQRGAVVTQQPPKWVREVVKKHMQKAQFLPATTVRLSSRPADDQPPAAGSPRADEAVYQGDPTYNKCVLEIADDFFKGCFN